MLRRRGWLLTLGPIGSASLLYVFVSTGFLHPDEEPGAGLGWALLGVLPTFVFGMWLLVATSSRMAVYVALAATGSAVGSAYETVLRTYPGIIHAEGFPAVTLVGLTADALSAVAGMVMIAAFPHGTVEHRWQRVTLRWVWLELLAGPLLLLTTDHVMLPMYGGLDGSSVPNPFALSSLQWAAPLVDVLFYQPWPAMILVLGVFYTRALGGDPSTRSQLRVMCWVTTISLVSFLVWSATPSLGLLDTPLETAVQVVVLASLIAVPVAAIHGILRHGAFDVAPDDRGPLVVSSSSLLITVLYGIGVATPTVLLSDSLTPVAAVLLTTVLAVALLPVRGWLQEWIRRTVLGDRDRHLALLARLGTRLEQTVGLGDVLSLLAQALRDGLGAEWVRIRLLDGDGDWAPTPEGLSGVVTGAPAMTRALTHGGERIGLVELGRRRSGAFGPHEQGLMETIARQASAAVANVRLTSLLEERLADLTASRLRLLSAQDDERRRIERDLHDGIQQNVVALIAGLRLARNRLSRKELTSDDLVELQDQARETLVDLREIAHGIHPPVLSDNGLVAAVESGVARYPVPLTLDATAAVRGERYPDDIETTAYYVVREALTNVAKHADATRARVALSRSNGHLRIEVEDDGRGFAPESAARSTGGLANMRDRVAAVKGRVTVSAHSRTGTVVTALLPVASVSAASRFAIDASPGMAADG